MPDEIHALTRNEAMELALRENYGLRVARLSIERAAAMSQDAGVLPNPEIGMSGASDFAFKNEGEYGWSASLDQKFPLTGRLRIERTLAEQEIALARTEVHVAELRLCREISSLFDQLESTQDEIALLTEQRILNSEFRQFLQTKVRRAEASSLDVRRARLEGAATEQRLSLLEREYANHLAELKHLCGLDSSIVLKLAEERSPVPDILQEYGHKAVRKHPAYLLKEQLASIASGKTDIARAKRWDDVALQVFYEESYGKDEPVGFEREHLLGMSVSIPIPLYNRNNGAIKSAKVRERQIAVEMEGTLFDLLSRSESLRHRYQDIQRQIAVYESELIQLSETSLTEIQNAYASGQVDLTEVFRAQEYQLELRLDMLELKRARAALLTEWNHITGKI